jgi:Ca-activated chloride channel family protein
MRALAVGLMLLAAPARAECALELILAVDVSGSVDPKEYALQTGGTAAAFRDPGLIEVLTGLKGHVIVAATQWSGSSRQLLSVPWTALRTEADMLAFADALEAAPRAYRHYSTAIGEALRHAAAVSGTAPERCRRRVVDVSGDGVNNEGAPPSGMRDALGAAGYVVNGLVIAGAEPAPAPYYHRNVIVGPGAFVEVADGFADYPRAILRKLLREMEAPAVVAAR